MRYQMSIFYLCMRTLLESQTWVKFLAYLTQVFSLAKHSCDTINRKQLTLTARWSSSITQAAEFVTIVLIAVLRFIRYASYFPICNYNQHRWGACMYEAVYKITCTQSSNTYWAITRCHKKSSTCNSVYYILSTTLILIQNASQFCCTPQQQQQGCMHGMYKLYTKICITFIQCSVKLGSCAACMHAQWHMHELTYI